MARLFEGIWNGAGTWDALAAEPPFDVYVHKTLTLAPKAGNPEPTIMRWNGSWVNRVGLRNPGLAKFLEEVAPRLEEQVERPVVLSVLGYSAAEWMVLLREAAALPFVAAVEVNLSCPNTDACEDPVAVVRHAIDLDLGPVPLVAKLGPAAHPETARRVGGYVDALTLCNTLPTEEGGLSGRAIHRNALGRVREAREIHPDLPIVGMGGVEDRASYQRMLDAGASAVGIGCRNLEGPGLALALKEAATKA